MKAYVQCPSCHKTHEVDIPSSQPQKSPEKRRKVEGVAVVWLFLVGFIFLAALAQFAGWM